MRNPLTLILLIVVAAAAVTGAQSQEGFRFKSGVEFVNVTATVTDSNGRFVSGLRQEDFTVYEDGQIQDVSHFSSDRVPVSLGIALDASFARLFGEHHIGRRVTVQLSYGHRLMPVDAGDALMSYQPVTMYPVGAITATLKCRPLASASVTMLETS